MASFRTKSYIIAKLQPRGWEVFYARPGSTKKEAWENAIDVAKIPKNEFMTCGWVCQEIFILSMYGPSK